MSKTSKRVKVTSPQPEPAGGYAPCVCHNMCPGAPCPAHGRVPYPEPPESAITRADVEAMLREERERVIEACERAGGFGGRRIADELKGGGK